MVGTEQADDLPIHLVGTPEFLPSVLSYISNAAKPTSLPIDQVIFQSLLLCILAGDKNLILRTPEEDVGLVVKLVTWTLTSVLNFTTHKFKIRARPSSTLKSSSASTLHVNPAIFLRSLFLPYSLSVSHSNHHSQDENSDAHPRHAHHQRGHPRATRKKSKPSYNSRSFSVPNDLKAAARKIGETSSLVPHVVESSSSYQPSSIHAKHRSERPLSSSGNPHEPIFHHAYSDPMPIRPNITTGKLHSKTQELPRALVVSGLENASLSSQRSLTRTLAERKIVFPAENDSRRPDTDEIFDELPGNDQDDVWDLPDGFLMIYVCPLNTREKPALHKSLLDRFALSSNIFVSQTVRHAFQSLPFPSRLPSLLHSNSYSNPSTPSSPLPLSLPQSQTPPYFPKPLPGTQRHRSHHSHHSHQSSHSHLSNAPAAKFSLPSELLTTLREVHSRTHISHTLSLYMSDLFSATRHHHELDGTLLTARAMKDAEELVRAGRVLGVDLTGTELVRPLISHREFSNDGDQSTTEYHDWVTDMREVSTDTVYEGSYFASEMRNGGDTSPASLDVAEVDVARIFPRVVSHRVSVRASREEEVLASAVFGAVLCLPSTEKTDDDGEDAEMVEERRTVKEIMVEILAEV